ncbi:CTP synthase 2-like isoform X2 [Styela clava]|uniref:CTP synthase 2-like n=1 Tax=Styela clava TaxID=7725 RepID=UPI00193AD9AA|nr:CTP synthase 2-like [Styela clava]
MKYILVSGGVISGIGKGIIASSIGTILKSCGLRVTAIKIDPYLNIDAGTFSPYEHGEVFVLDDGGEVDLDLGNYERFLNVKLHRDNNITTGKIYQQVINKERRGDYLGKTVQVVPHVTNAIMEWVEKVAKIPVDNTEASPEVCIIELGGTVGDIEGMPFVEAFRQFQFRVKQENFCNIHVSLVPQPTAGEQKSMPTQNSVRALRGLGLSPDLIVCRSKTPLEKEVREKISNICHVGPSQVIGVHDFSCIYHVPLLLQEQNLTQYFAKRLSLTIRPRKSMLYKWRTLAEKHDRVHTSCTIALVGKYTKLEDAYASVIKALRHSAIMANRKLELTIIEAAHLEEEMKTKKPVEFYEAWKKLCCAQGVLVPGGFGNRGTEGKIAAVHWARTHNKPFLGICLGMQMAVIEFARNELGLKGANSTENAPDTENPVVIDMPEHTNGNMGGTMRLGARKTIFKTECMLKKLYKNKESIEERHRHRYEVNPSLTHLFEEKGFRFVAQDTEGVRMEAIELDDHPFFVGIQSHPEFKSRPLEPSPPYLGFILASCGKLPQYMQRGCRLSPRHEHLLSTEEGDSDLEEELSKIVLEGKNHSDSNDSTSSESTKGSK